jgi:hypothetical protein
MEISPLEEMAAYIAFIHQKAGIDGIQQILEQILTQRPNRASYEMMAKVAAELRSTGLLETAKGSKCSP